MSAQFETKYFLVANEAMEYSVFEFESLGDFFVILVFTAVVSFNVGS